MLNHYRNAIESYGPTVGRRRRPTLGSDFPPIQRIDALISELYFVSIMPQPTESGISLTSGALPEHTRVALRRDQPEAGLLKGQKGTIVHVYAEGGYEVEFIEGRDKPVVVTLELPDVEGLGEK